jgi:hypothetical protein
MAIAGRVALVVLVLALVSCSRGGENTPTATVVLTATPLPPGSGLPITPLASNTPELAPSMPTPTLAATAPATPLPSPTPLPPTDTPGPELYRVAFVLSNDVLNVRDRPGVDNPMIGSLSPNATDVEITGAGTQVDPSLWVPIQAGRLTGWVNSRFLTGQVDTDAFCHDAGAEAIIEQLKASVQARDGQALAALVHPQRGLRLRHDWWNSEVKLTGDEVSRFYTAPTRYDWGHADGSGLPISGSVRDVLLPLLDKDLVGATKLVCGAVAGGPTAGMLQLPYEYEAVNIYTVYRPVPDDGQDYDWGSWAVGIEYWQGQLYLSFLVHYAWEI